MHLVRQIYNKVSPLGSAAGAAAGVEAGAETGEGAGRENSLAKQHVAPKDKRGRWAGINSTTEGRETRSPEILSPLRRGGSE